MTANADTVDLAPLHAYRHPCAQLLGGIVAGDIKSIMKAVALRERLDEIADSIDDSPDNEGQWRAVYDAADAHGMALALDIALGDSAHICPRDVEIPDVDVSFLVAS